MKVRILYFAYLRNLTQKKKEDITLPEGSSISHLHDCLQKKYAKFFSDTSFLAVAVNEEYARSDKILKEGDTVCFIPPVAGG